MIKKVFIFICLLINGFALPTHLGFQSLNEEVTERELKVTGKVPEWLKGTLVRNGPAKFDLKGEYLLHWFDGLAMLHGFSFEKGKIIYTNKFLRTGSYDDLVVKEKIGGFLFATQMEIEKTSTEFLPNANVNVTTYDDRWVALTETSKPVVFDPKTLETLGIFNYKDAKGWGFESAHPIYDPARKEMINLFIEYSGSDYELWKLKEGSREVFAKVPTDKIAYMHSFALTDHFIILPQFPFVFDPSDASKKEGIFKYSWEPERGLEFLIIERETGKWEKLKGDPFFAFHQINAYEEGQTLIVDFIAYSEPPAFLKGEKKASSPPKVLRCYLDRQSKQVREEPLFDISMEFPRINELSQGKPYRYFYAVDSHSITRKSGLLYKLDLKEKEISIWSQEGTYPSETIFIPKPDAKKEDEGILLCVVLDENAKNSFLLILDASDLHEIARAEIPHPIPFGLHGQFFGKSLR